MCSRGSPRTTKSRRIWLTRAGRGADPRWPCRAAYFEVLGLRAALGRLIGPQDEPSLDEARVAVLSHEYWRSELGGDPGVIGRALTVNGQALTIIGVAPAGFSGTVFGVRPQAFVPLTMRYALRDIPRNQAENRFAFGLSVFGRLRPEIGLEQASAGDQRAARPHHRRARALAECGVHGAGKNHRASAGCPR